MGVQKRSRRAAPKKAPPQVNVLEIGNKVWLAGLGALARAQKEGPKLFEALVEEGATVQERTRDTSERALKQVVGEVRDAMDARMDMVRERAGETWDNIEKMFEIRVQKTLQQLGVPSAHEIRALSRKVDELNRSVKELAPKGNGRRAPARKAPAPTSQPVGMV